jgi:hypothetical protein
LLLLRFQAVSQVGAEEVGGIGPACHGCVGSVAGYLLCLFPPPPELGLVGQRLDIVGREAGWLQADARSDGTLRRRTAEGVGAWSQRIDKAVGGVGRVFALVEKVVQEVVGVALLARPALGGMVAVVDDQVQVPVTLLAVRGNLVCGIVGGVFAGDGKERLLGLGE